MYKYSSLGGLPVLAHMLAVPPPSNKPLGPHGTLLPLALCPLPPTRAPFGPAAARPREGPPPRPGGGRGGMMRKRAREKDGERKYGMGKEEEVSGELTLIQARFVSGAI